MSFRIYTRSGDDGTTGLVGGIRVNKNSCRVEAYGTVDELNATLGMSIALHGDPTLEDVLCDLQNELFILGADLATPGIKQKKSGKSLVERINSSHTARLEEMIDHFEAELLPLSTFILPGGTPLAASLHFARVICRRAERCTISLYESEAPEVNLEAVKYLNRLSDLLFVMARVANLHQQVTDIPWISAKADNGI